MHKIQLMYIKDKDETLLDTDWFLIKVILPLVNFPVSKIILSNCVESTLKIYIRSLPRP